VENRRKCILVWMAEFSFSESAGVLYVPQPWASSPEAQHGFRRMLATHAAPLLICDYDGTLAPFREDKMQAAPYPGVVDRLACIAAGPTRLAFVSGRPVGELIMLLPLAAEAELWGMHGREHRTADGTYDLIEPTAAQRMALDQAQAELYNHGLKASVERKAASVALHWRTLADAGEGARLKQFERLALETFSPHVGEHALALLPFDGGLELRAEDHTKGHAVEALLAGADGHASAFLGDDTTDEDAFRVLRARGGLTLLVREPPRPSHAGFSLKPPAELLAFLDSWISALAVTGSPTTRLSH